MMSVNAIKYKGELLAEDGAIRAKPPGTLGEYKELRADALEADTLDLTVVSESGTIRSFRKNDKVEYFRGGRRAGIYYLQSVTRAGPKLYTLSALSAVGLLIARPHRGGIYNGETVAEVVAEICGDLPVLVETIYRGIKLYGWLPIASARDNLVQVLFAIGAWLHTDETGTLRVQKLWSGTASTIGAGRVHAANIQGKYLDPVSAVAVTEHQYVKGTEEVTLFEGTAQQGDVIEFDAPAHTLTAEGFAVLESGVNYAVLSAGTGKLTGRAYIHNMRVVTRTVTEGAAENVEQITDATLVSLVNSSAVAQRMAAYYACREQLTVDVDPTAERAGHVVSIWSEWDKQLTLACIASRETRISGLLKSRTTALVGFVPPQPETAEFYDERVLLTGSGEWTVPDGVTEIRAVLIGGGQGGKHGADGEKDPAQNVRTTTDDDTDSAGANRRYVYIRYSPGGEGGASGEPGMGGKVLVQSLSNLTSGGSIAYSCGIGGAGATDAAATGANGTATTFGSLSSDSGSSSDGGYTDTTTGEVFAAKGAAGIPGSHGRGKEFVEGTGYVVVESPSITVGDVVYVAGADNSARGEDGEGNWKTAPYGYIGYEWNGGLGGGAAYGNNGIAATASGSGYARVSSGYASVNTAPGGKGADAAAPPKATRYGSGGTGGNGGGGAGGSGVANAHQTVSKAITSEAASLNAAQIRSAGGLGSAGGEGADGCIIIYYRRPKPIQPGWLKDKNGKLLLERLNKRLIV